MSWIYCGGIVARSSATLSSASGGTGASACTATPGVSRRVCIRLQSPQPQRQPAFNLGILVGDPPDGNPERRQGLLFVEEGELGRLGTKASAQLDERGHIHLGLLEQPVLGG